MQKKSVVKKAAPKTKKFADGGAVGSNQWIGEKATGLAKKALGLAASPSKESNAAGDAYSKQLAAERKAKQDAAERAEGARLQAMPATKPKPPQNPTRGMTPAQAEAYFRKNPSK